VIALDHLAGLEPHASSALVEARAPIEHDRQADARVRLGESRRPREEPVVARYVPAAMKADAELRRAKLDREMERVELAGREVPQLPEHASSVTFDVRRDQWNARQPCSTLEP
jgi:hypothetical protein